MDIFGQLGINSTAGIQFVFFAIALLFLTKFVFTPYAHALEERQRKTKGGEELALEYQAKSIELSTQYESKIRDLNSDIKGLVDASKSEANKQYESIVSKSRQEADRLVAENRAKIAKAVEVATQELKSQTQTVALAITSKLLGK